MYIDKVRFDIRDSNSGNYLKINILKCAHCINANCSRDIKISPMTCFFGREMEYEGIIYTARIQGTTLRLTSTSSVRAEAYQKKYQRVLKRYKNQCYV